MQMPSLFKYFAVVGACLLGLLTLTNFLLDPSTVANSVAPPKPVVTVQHDPRASKIERWRDEQAALKAAEQKPAGENASLVTKSAPEPYRPAATAQATPQAQPVALMQSAEVAATAGAETEDEAAAARAAKIAEDKAKLAKAKARKARLARERARSTAETAGYGGVPVAGHYGYPRERTASSQQDQYYYGQRSGGPQAAPGYGYAQRQSFGPFGWGRGW